MNLLKQRDPILMLSISGMCICVALILQQYQITEQRNHTYLLNNTMIRFLDTFQKEQHEPSSTMDDAERSAMAYLVKE